MKTAITQSCLFSKEKPIKVLEEFKEICDKGLAVCFPDDDGLVKYFNTQNLHYLLPSIIDYGQKNESKFFFVKVGLDGVKDLTLDSGIYEGKDNTLNGIFRGYYLTIVQDNTCTCVAIGAYDKLNEDEAFEFTYQGHKKKLVFWRVYRIPVPDLLSNLETLTENLQLEFQNSFIIGPKFLDSLHKSKPNEDNFKEAMDKIVYRHSIRDSIKGDRITLCTGQIIDIPIGYKVLECSINTSCPNPQRVYFSYATGGIHLWGIGHEDK